LSGETRLLVELPYDPKTDSMSLMAFLADRAKNQILVMSQSDLALGRVSEADLERHCRAYNRRNTGITAGLFKPQEGARPRLHLAAALPIKQMQTQKDLAESLNRQFRIERQFWHYLRLRLPI
jgi:hypothetical protein